MRIKLTSWPRCAIPQGRLKNIKETGNIKVVRDVSPHLSEQSDWRTCGSHSCSLVCRLLGRVMCLYGLCVSVPHELPWVTVVIWSSRHQFLSCWVSMTLEFLILRVKETWFVGLFFYLPHVPVHESFRNSCGVWHLFGIKAPQLHIYEVGQPLFEKKSIYIFGNCK